MLRGRLNEGIEIGRKEPEVGPGGAYHRAGDGKAAEERGETECQGKKREKQGLPRVTGMH